MTYVRNEGVNDLPGIDGSGPMGAGPMSGRGLGLCTEVNGERYGVGFGRGFGRGRAYRCGFGPGFGPAFARGFGRGVVWNQPSPKTRKELLQEERDMLKGRLEAIDEQLVDL